MATPEQMAPLRAEFDNVGRRGPEAQKAGVRIVLGDDYGIIVLPHGRYAEELEFNVKQVGVARLDGIRWATRNGGELMGLPVGQVKEGFLADLLVVDGDPSADVSVLQVRSRIRVVLKGGRFVKDTL